MKLTDKQIAVIGAGPGGLTLARLLQLKGASVKVYERDINSSARVQGSPLDMHEESGWIALREAGLIDAFKKNVRSGADKKIIVNEQAVIFFSDHDTTDAVQTKEEPARPEIDRGTLRKIFLDSLQPETVIWNSQFLSMESQGNGWLLHFKDGTSPYADLVIGSDGANSKVRPYVTSILPYYSGVTMVEINVDNAATTTPQIYSLLNGGKVMAFGNGKNILGGQKGNGGLGFYASFKPEENWAVNSGINFSDRAAVLNWFKKEYSEWSPVWHEIIEHASTPVIPRPVYCMPPDQYWKPLSNVTVLGDAAHVMPPFAGEGANTSMYDAVELTQCLTAGQYETLQSAIAAYEISMRQRAAIAARQSLENGERMHSEGALQKMMSVFGNL